MTYFFYSGGFAWSSIALLALTATAVHAQSTASTAPVVTAGQPVAPPVFSSVFDGYQPYTEEKTANWRQANDNTARIGGWRAYAKEAAEPNPAMLPTPAITPATTPAKP